MGLFQVGDKSDVPTSKPSLESLQSLTKILHVHSKWQDLIFKGEKTWELSHWGKPQKQTITLQCQFCRTRTRIGSSTLSFHIKEHSVHIYLYTCKYIPYIYDAFLPWSFKYIYIYINLDNVHVCTCIYIYVFVYCFPIVQEKLF